MDDDELARRISDEGVSLRGYRMEFKEVRLSKLHSKIVYVRRVSLSRSFSKKSSQSSSKPNTELESFKEILANIYISNGTIMMFALRNLLQQKILRNSMDRIRASVTNNQKLELPNLLKSLQQRKRLNYQSWALYKLSFQQKKKKEGLTGNSQPSTPVRRLLPRRTDLIAKPRVHINPRHLLPDLVHTASSHNHRILVHWSFHKLVENSRLKYCKYNVPIRNMCLAINGVLISSFSRIRSHTYHNRKAVSVTLFQMEFKFKGLTADRIKHLNIQIEDLRNSKTMVTKRLERSLKQIEQAVNIASKQVNRWQQTVAEKQAILDNLVAIEEKKRNRVVQDYFPLLRRIYCQYEAVNVPFFKRGLIIKKNGINLSGLLEWPEVVLSQNQKLRLELQLYQAELVADGPEKNLFDHRRQALEEELSQMRQLVRGYIRQSYRYPILEKQRHKLVDMEKDYDAIGVLLERGDTSGLKLIFEMT